MEKICNVVRPELVRKEPPVIFYAEKNGHTGRRVLQAKDGACDMTDRVEDDLAPYMPAAFPGTSEAPFVRMQGPDPWEMTGLPGLYRDLVAPVHPPSAADVVAALQEARQALHESSEATQREYNEVQKQLPWLARRLGRKMARLILPCVVASTVVFAALSLPVMALLLGAVAGAATWLSLADKDPNPQRSMPEHEVPRRLRPRLAADTLESQMQVYADAKDHLTQMLQKPGMSDDAFANQTFKLFVAKIHELLAENTNVIKPLEDERSRSVGARAMAGPASHWLVSAGALGMLNGLNAMVDLPFPFGGVSRYVAASITWPLLQLITLFYGAQMANKWRASLDSRQQVVADRLHVRRGEREALQEVLNVYRRAQYRLDARLPGVVQLKFRLLDALGRPR